MTDFLQILGFEPNQEQKQALMQIEKFVESEEDVFILKGSAGTGKTSIVKAITNKLAKDNINFYVNAPTGRAAMIIGTKTNQQSKTMHSQIYIPEKVKGSIAVKMIRKINQEDAFSVFFVDEASMISNTVNTSKDFQVSKPLLYDFIDYVKQGNKRNKIVFIGDKFQLPPIKENFSTALNADYLSDKFKLKCSEYELNKVMRQADNSDVLEIATFVRDEMKQGIFNINVPVYKEIFASHAMRKYLSYFDFNRLDKIIAVCSTNRDVDYWNIWIRKELGINNTHLSVNDIVVNQNNWNNNNGDWVHNGEFGKINAVENKIEKFSDLNFVNAEVEFPTSLGKSKKITTKILLDSLYTKYGILKEEHERRLYADVMRYNRIFRKTEDICDDKYLNAMRIKHGYATTCHKAQGGEWDNVLIHPWRIGKDLRWTYTAITRARKNVFSYAA